MVRPEQGVDSGGGASSRALMLVQLADQGGSASSPQPLLPAVQRAGPCPHIPKTVTGPVRGVWRKLSHRVWAPRLRGRPPLGEVAMKTPSRELEVILIDGYLRDV